MANAIKNVNAIALGKFIEKENSSIIKFAEKTTGAHEIIHLGRFANQLSATTQTVTIQGKGSSQWNDALRRPIDLFSISESGSPTETSRCVDLPTPKTRGNITANNKFLAAMLIGFENTGVDSPPRRGDSNVAEFKRDLTRVVDRWESAWPAELGKKSAEIAKKKKNALLD